MSFEERIAESSSFHFKDPKERKVGGRTIITLQTDLIRKIEGSCKDKHGNSIVIRNYIGAVKIDKVHIYDIALTCGMGDIYGSYIKRKGKKTKYPQYGFYGHLRKSDLIVDIDEKGNIWLTKPTFYEQGLLKKLEELKKKPKDINVRKELEEVYNVLEELEHDKVYEYLATSERNRLSDLQDQYYSSLQDELSRDEEGRMDIETDGFWRVQDDE